MGHLEGVLGLAPSNLLSCFAGGGILAQSLAGSGGCQSEGL